MSHEDAKSRDERRRKIRELEASLFGASTVDSFKVTTTIYVDSLKKLDRFTNKPICSKTICFLEQSPENIFGFDIRQVDLPELKNVDEYSTNFGKAERQKRYTPLKIEDYLPKKPPTTSKTSKTSKTTPKNVKKDDQNPLLSDDDDDDEDQENYDVLKSMTQKVWFNSIGQLVYALHIRVGKIESPFKVLGAG